MTPLYPTQLLPVFEFMSDMIQDRMSRYSHARYGTKSDFVEDISAGQKHISGTGNFAYHGCGTERWDIRMPIEYLDESEEEFQSSLREAEAEYKEEQKQKREAENKKDRKAKEIAFEHLKKELNK